MNTWLHESTSHFWGAKVARLLKAGKISSPAIVIPTEPDKKVVRKILIFFGCSDRSYIRMVLIRSQDNFKGRNW